MSEQTEREWVKNTYKESEEDDHIGLGRCINLDTFMSKIAFRLDAYATVRDEFRKGYEGLAARLRELDAENLALTRELAAMKGE